MNRKKIVVITSILVIVFSVICSVLPLITKNELAEKNGLLLHGWVKYSEYVWVYMERAM